jgi:hypothetical protein
VHKIGKAIGEAAAFFIVPSSEIALPVFELLGVKHAETEFGADSV